MIKDISLSELSIDIQMKRSEMYTLANKFGYTDERTVRNSQELDEMIVAYQNYVNSSGQQQRKPSLYMKIYYQSGKREIKFNV